jgi:hypothetical protein
MDFELDHVFICVEAEANEATCLIEAGLIEGAPNVHMGQGTANRRFFFRNAYLELLWVHDQASAQAPGIERTRLWERWKDRRSGACPFGFCFRPKAERRGKCPFPSWEYKPPYLRESLSMYIGNNSDALGEPMLVYLPFAQRPDSLPGKAQQPMKHEFESNEIRSIEFFSPHANNCSAELQAVIDANLVKVRPASEFVLEVTLNGKRLGKRPDFRPELPLVFA